MPPDYLKVGSPIDANYALARRRSHRIWLTLIQFDNFVKMVRLRRITVWSSSLSRFSQMLDAEIKRRGKSEREVAREFGWSQQAFNTWLKGGIPRQQFYLRLGDFLNISQDNLVALLDEARGSDGSTKLPNLGAPLLGRGTASHVIIEKFPFGWAAPQVDGAYAVRIDGRVHWVNPSLTPAPGNTVLVRDGALGHIDTWPCAAEVAHVIVLSEMI